VSTTDLSEAVRRLVAAVEAVPGAGRPHVRSREDAADGTHLTLASGTTITLAAEAWPDRPLAEVPLPAVAAERAALEAAGEGYDLNRLEASDHVAEELRGAAPTAVVEVVARAGGHALRMVVRQPLDALWAAEDAGAVGEDFQDFVERNAAWAALGLRRPRRGWSLTVRDPVD
jgi:hypothetical protein